MKNINYVINGVLAVAVVILYIMQFSGKKESSVTRTSKASGRHNGLTSDRLCKCGFPVT